MLRFDKSLTDGAISGGLFLGLTETVPTLTEVTISYVGLQVILALVSIVATMGLSLLLDLLKSKIAQSKLDKQVKDKLDDLVEQAHDEALDVIKEGIERLNEKTKK